MKKIILYSLVMTVSLSFLFMQFSLADYTKQEKASRLTSEQWQQRIETYCDECAKYSANQELDDYLNSAEISDLMNQDRSKDGRWLWKWLSKCKWIKLNTNFPIIWNCIETWGWKTNATQAFPTMIGALTKIIMALVLIVCFIFVIIAGIKRASDDPKTARSIIIKVGITVLLLW